MGPNLFDGTYHVGRHGVKDTGIDRSRRRHVQIGGSTLSKLPNDRKFRCHTLIEQRFRDSGRRLIPLVGFHLFEGNRRWRLGGEEATAEVVPALEAPQQRQVPES